MSVTSPLPRPETRKEQAVRFGNEHRTALLVLTCLTVFRLVYGAHLGMAQDEMYYWQWSRHPELSYYDQGPGVAWCIRLGTTLFGDTPLGIRFVGILLGAGTGWLTYRTVGCWAGNRVAGWTLLLTSVAPLLAAGGVLATYDGPQVFFWAAALYALTRTLQEERAAGWYAVGLLVGLGLLCKLTMLLFAPGVLLFLLLSPPRYRRWLATPHPWLAFAIALVFFAPVIWWNAAHGWMGFLHTVTLGSRRRNAAPFRWFGDFLGGQAIALGPLLFLAELYAVAALTRFAIKPDESKAARWAIPVEAARFIAAFSAPTLALCLVVSLKSKMEINWPAPTHLMGLAAVAVWFAAVWSKKTAVGRGWIGAAAALSLLVSLVAFFPALLPAAGLHVSANAAQKLNETYGWDEIMGQVENARRTLERDGGDKPVFLAGINYRVDSALAFGLPDHPQTNGLYFNSRRDQYFLWTDPSRMVGQNALLCLDDQNDEAIALARQYFVSVTPLPPIEIIRPGFSGVAKHWYLYECRDFKGYDANAHVDGY